MNFDLTEEQVMIRDMFAGFLDENSSGERVRAALPSGFDPALWHGLAELGALSMRVPEEAGGMGLGLFDAAVLMEEAGRTLASGPLTVWQSGRAAGRNHGRRQDCNSGDA
jgi:3-oxochol-4-en-24-oyl-CoA dehydrogenase